MSKVDTKPEGISDREYTRKVEENAVEATRQDRERLDALENRVTALTPKPYDERLRVGTCCIAGCTEPGVGNIDTNKVASWMTVRFPICVGHEERSRKGERFVIDFMRVEGHLHLGKGD